ncbi:MAG: FAD-dependent oxidoreductase [Planctomycetes bacterium]|nr:FAD-dependent oxidoreductase [Planctomycetota bacterium]
MPRTHLLSHLRTLVARFRNGSSVGLPPAAVLDRTRSSRLPSRRDVLKGAGAGAMALAVPDRRWRRPPARVAVVGGGLPGLVAATPLRGRGIVPGVFEAGSRLGGRVFTNRTTFAASGQFVEHGGELIDSGHKNLRKLVRQLGLEVDDLIAAEPAGTQAIGWFGNARYTFADAEDDFTALYHALHQDLVHAGYPATYDSYSPLAEALDAMSIDAWIALRVPGGLASPLGQLLSVAYDIEFGAPSNDQSALNLLYLLGYGCTPNNFEIFGASDERYRVRGGNDQVPALLAAQLAGQIRLGHRLTAAATTIDDRTRLSFDTAGGAVEETYDRVVMTVPFAVLRAAVDLQQLTLSPKKRIAIHQMGMGTNAKLHVQFSDRHWYQLGCNGVVYGDTGFQNTWEETRAQAGAAGILDNYLGSNGPSLAGKTPQTAAADFLTSFEPALPGISAKFTGNASIDYWPGSPNQRGSYSYWRVGQYVGFAGVEKEIEGSVHFAGEHTSIDFQGYMEGAVESGMRAAAEVVAAL